MRYSRHFYDLYKMLKSKTKDESYEDLQLLYKVVEFKKKFYPCNWAKYDDIYSGELKLFLSREAIDSFSKDYTSMSIMIFGDKPTFEEIMRDLKIFEVEINERIKSKLIEKI